MDSWKFNSTAQHVLRVAIANNLSITYSDVYKTVKTIVSDEVYTKDGKRYKIILKEI